MVRLSCLYNDDLGNKLDLIWETEVHAKFLGDQAWKTIGQGGFAVNAYAGKA